MKVKELREQGIAQAIVDLFPQECSICGSELEITESLKEFYCPNPYCAGKAVQRMLGLLRDIGVTTWDACKVAKYMSNCNTLNPYHIYTYKEEDGAIGDITEECMQGVYNTLPRKIPLSRYVQIGNYPKLRSCCNRLFKGYSDIRSFYRDFEEDPVYFIQGRLGLDLESEDTVYVQALDIVESLMTYKMELFEYADLVDMQIKERVVGVSITGFRFEDKRKWFRQIGKECNIYVMETAVEDSDYVLWKEEVETQKVKRALKLGKPLYTIESFRQVLMR